MLSLLGLLAGTPSVLIKQIQRVQNSTVTLVTKSKKHDHVTPLLAKHYLQDPPSHF